MTKLRMIDLGDASITVECVLSLFRNAPDLISLRAEVISERMRLVNEESGIEVTEGDDFGNDVRRMGYLEKYCPPGSEHIWKEGLGKLKALNISVRGHPLDTAYDLALNISMQEHPQDTSYDLVMDLADGLGRNLESVGVYIGGTESRSAMDYIIRKVTSNCPNLKDVTVGTRGDMASVRRLLHSRPPLQYLSLSGGLSDEIIKVIVYTCTTLKFLSVDCRGLPRGSFRQLAQGPFLRGCQIHSWDVEMDQNDLHEFFKQRGHTLESLSLEYYFPWGSSETPADGVLDCLAEYAANLRVLHMTYVSEESVLKFMHASRNLKRLCLDEKLMASSSIQVAAAEKNVSFSDPDSFEGFGIPYTFGGPPYPTYVEVMKARERAASMRK
ncbi:hypothetical protein HK104_008652 [Borealophlyctis nickersoniae]|nr:hypothetical protein HK104_008652 [Borealophlyctis nickersoniae]